MSRVQEWFAGPIGPACLIAAATSLLAVWLGPATRAPEPAPVFYATEGALSAEAGEALVSRVVGGYQSASVHHVRAGDELRPHYHRVHDETVVVLKGAAHVAIGDEVRTVGPGTVLLIPRGTVHSAEPADGPSEVVSVFSPAFDGRDRIVVE